MMRGAVAFAILIGALHAAHVVSAGSPAGPPVDEPSVDTRLNINTADSRELTSLPGIGPTRAEAIIEERQRRRFRRIEDILRVPGVGRKTFNRIRHSIRVE